MTTTDAYGNLHDDGGRFSEKHNSAPGPSASLAASALSTPASLRSLDQIVFETVTTDPRLPGTLRYRDSNALTYTDEDGVEFPLAIRDSAYSIRCEESDAETSNIIMRIEAAPSPQSIRRAQRIADDLVRVVESHRDKRALTHIGERLAQDLHQLDPHAPSLRISEYRGTVKVGDPDINADGEVVFDEFTLNDEMFDDHPSLRVTVPGATRRDRDEAPRQFHLVCRPDWSIEAWGESEGRCLSDWETRGLFAEINRRAGVPDSSSSLASELIERSIDVRRMERLRRGVV